LFRENYENWFKRTRVKIKKKGAYYSIDSNKTKYIWIYKEGKAAKDSKEGKTTIPTNTNISKIDNFTNKFKRIRGSWNIEQIEK